MKAKPTSTQTLVMEAVDQFKGQVTIGDVATQTGLALPIAKQELLQLAQNSTGHLQVSEQGELIFAFPDNFRKILAQRQQLDQWSQRQQQLWAFLLRALRVSFGIFLIGEFVLIVLAFILIIFSGRAGSDNNDRDDDSPWNVMWLPNLWWGNPFWDPMYSPQSSPQQHSRRMRDAASEMNFLDAVYSFLFGDGNPNLQLEKRRFQLIGRKIRQLGGVITGEQVLPYLVVEPKSALLEYEDFMLPILLNFDGYPEVNESGDIVYRFPELQVTTSHPSDQPTEQRIPTMLQEKPWQFSRASAGQLSLAIGLGLANFFGSWSLALMFRPQLMALGGVAAWINGLLGILVTYGTLFLVVPALRGWVLHLRNQKVIRHNIQYQQWAQQIERPSPELERKLQFAQGFVRREIASEDSVIYTTAKALAEQTE